MMKKVIKAAVAALAFVIAPWLMAGCAMNIRPSGGDLMLLIGDSVSLDPEAVAADYDVSGMTLIDKTFGGALDTAALESYALRVPYRAAGVGEIGIFLVGEQSDARKTVIAVKKRIAELENKKNAPKPELFTCGRWICYACTDDNAEVGKIIRRYADGGFDIFKLLEWD